MNGERKIRVLSVMEAGWVNGPAKNLIAAARELRQLVATPPAEIFVATFVRTEESNPFVSALRAAGIPTHAIREKHVGDPRIVPQLLSVLKSVRPDIVETHGSKPHFLIRCLGIGRRLPWIAFHHGYTARDFRDRLYSRIGWWALRGAPRIVPVCAAFARELCRAGVPESRITVRHNSVLPYTRPDPEELAAVRRRLGIPSGAPVLLAIGRLSSEKGHADLLEAVALLRGRGAFPSARVVIVGDGPERKALEARLRHLGLADCVVLAGHSCDVRPYYGIAGLLVLPSHSEGSPNVLLEAMAAGLPIVTTSAGGAAELITDGSTGLVVPPRDPRALCAAIERLLADGALAARLAAVAQAVSHRYTPEAYARAVHGIYRDMLGAGFS